VCNDINHLATRVDAALEACDREVTAVAVPLMLLE
jgi:hypothetical protein